MKIGIIGTGLIGGAIAKKMVAAGHLVKVYSADEFEKLKGRAHELGALPSKLEDLGKDVDVLILSVPTNAIGDLPKKLFADLPEHVVVVDTSNYYPFRDADIKALQNGTVESMWVAEQIGHPVIKAFNNLLAHTLEHGGRPKGAEGRIAMAVSGDDLQSKDQVSKLINEAGFDVVDAGTLADSWRHQPGTPAYCTELTMDELRRALADGKKEDAARLRDNAIGNFMERSTPPSHEEVVAMNRSLFPKNPKTA